MTSEVDRHLQSNYAIVVDENDLEIGSIARQSVVRIDKVIVVSEERIYRPGIARLKPTKIDKILRSWAKLVVDTHYRAVHLPLLKKPFIPGESRIPYGGRVYDEREIFALVDSSLDFWLTMGRYAREFEDKFASFLGAKYCSLTNSGSSANLLAFIALTSPKLGDRRIRPGDEVITVAACFPTTVAPIIQFGAVPVFVDVELPTANVDCSQLEAALSEKTKAVMLAHTLGNPFDLENVKAFCDEHGLWLIEDNCDALGSKYLLDGEWKYTGTVGHIGTCSFYPSHHITMGEGGAVLTNDSLLKRLVESFRDWGRDCWCPSGRDNTCGHRFDRQFGELPYGYDHKYIYSHFGYNLKVTDMQAAIGCAQLEKLPDFIESRKRNWRPLREGLADLGEWFELPEPAPLSEPSWFGFLLVVKKEAGFTRDQIVSQLESAGIQTRMLFAGNIIKHPCFDGLRGNPNAYRVASKGLPVTDRIMANSFWLGVYPGMTPDIIDYMLRVISGCCERL
jgi:CDP-6-deoxy-D-xylo-4-hexulose-3-dehydrase